MHLTICRTTGELCFPGCGKLHHFIKTKQNKTKNHLLHWIENKKKFSAQNRRATVSPPELSALVSSVLLEVIGYHLLSGIVRVLG